MKTKRRSKRPRQTRATLAKRIAQEPTIKRKWSVALGQAMTEDFEPDSELALQSLAYKWRVNALIRHKNAEPFRDPRIFIVGETPSTLRKAILEDYAELGYLAAQAIMDQNDKFFSGLARIVQYDIYPGDKDPKERKLYADILECCRWSGSGTPKRPCDATRLHAFLVKRGHTFNDPYEHQTPRTLRAVCKKLGVIITSKGPGRPRKNLQR